MRVGWLDAKVWRLGDQGAHWTADTRRQMEDLFARAVAVMADGGASVHEYTDLAIDSFSAGEDGKKSLFYEIAMYEFQHSRLPRFLEEFSYCEVGSLQDIIAYNERHKELAMPLSHPNQDDLQHLLDNPRSKADTDIYITEMRRRGCAALDRAFESHDVLIALAESPLCQWTSAAGYPLACLPMGAVVYSEENERPVGMVVAAGKGKEELLLRFMAAWEASGQKRPLPRPLLDSKLLNA